MLFSRFFPPPRHSTVQTQKNFEAVTGLACATFQRPLFDPNAAARCRPGACDGRQALARQQQWFHLLGSARQRSNSACQSIGGASATGASARSVIAASAFFMSRPASH